MMQLSQLSLCHSHSHSPSLLRHRVACYSQLGVAWHQMENTLRPVQCYTMEYPVPALCRPHRMEQSDGNRRNFMEPGPLNDPFPTTVRSLISISQGGPEGHRFI